MESAASPALEAVGGALRARVEGGGTQTVEAFGVDSEYGTLRDVLVGDPSSFRWLGAENAAYSALVRETLRKGHRFDRELALRQHEEMLDAFRDAGVAVHALPADDGLAYGVYARDSSVMTPWGALVCQLANPRRRGEYAPALRFYLEHGIPVYDLVSAGTFEGGDLAILEPGFAVVGFTGQRSEEVAARQVGGWIEREGWEVAYAPIDEFYVHVDLMVCTVAEKLAAVCLETTEPELVERLRARRIEIVPVGFRETMALGCNVVALGADRVLSSAVAVDLNRRLRALGLTVYDPDVSQFQLAGGGVHCMCQPLRRDPA
jgi:N-dimethylarginine dimethylaminohydrolase